MSALSCLLLWFCVCSPFSPPTQVASSPSARKRSGERVLFFSALMTAAAAAHRNRSVVTHRRYSSNRWSVKEKALQSHTGVWFSTSLSAYFNTCLGQGSSWLMVAVAAEKQNKMRGCWHEISAPSVKIRRITISEIHHPHFWIWKSSISHTVCTGFQGCFAQVPRI